MEDERHFKIEYVQVYALIYSNYCTKTMQVRIEEHPDFTTKIRNDPVELLEAIKTLTHDPVRAHYPFASMHDALTSLVNLKQIENESTLDYAKRAKQQSDVVISYCGKNMFTEFIKHTEEYRNETDAQKKADMEAGSHEQYMAYLLLKNSDPLKFGSVLKGLQSQYSLGNAQYPKTLTAAIDVLSNHKLDRAFYDNRNRKKKEQQQRNKEQSDSTDDQSQATSFAQRKVTC
jgi:hypothetical protein